MGADAGCCAAALPTPCGPARGTPATLPHWRVRRAPDDRLLPSPGLTPSPPPGPLQSRRGPTPVREPERLLLPKPVTLVALLGVDAVNILALPLPEPHLRGDAEAGTAPPFFLAALSNHHLS